MATFSIVEHFDVLEQISTGFLAGSVANPVYTLALEGTEEALHDSIVIAVMRHNRSSSGIITSQCNARVIHAEIEPDASGSRTSLD
jgi:hypothetical protein